MSTDAWNWPGARWWKFDLHVHTPGSSDWKQKDATAAQWVETAIEKGIQAIAVTDHNSANWVDKVKDAAKGTNLTVFPGAEITVESGVHLLVIFSPDVGTAKVTAFAGACELNVEAPKNAEIRTAKSFLDVARIARAHDAITIAAHVDTATTGLIGRSLGGLELKNALLCSDLSAFEWVGAGAGTDVLQEKLEKGWKHLTDPGPSFKRAGGPLPILSSSDAHALDEIGRRYTWIKMSQPSFEGLQLALDTRESVLRCEDQPESPNVHASDVIESISVKNTRFMGNGTPLEVRFNPWLNTLIGGRGTGKSSLVEFMRLVLRREKELPEKPSDLQADFNSRMRTYASRTDRGLLRADSEVELIYRRDGARFRIRWSRDATAHPIEEESDGGWVPSEGDIPSRFPVRIFSQKQILNFASDSRKLLELIDQSLEVDAASIRSKIDADTARFLEIQTKIRTTETRLGDVSRVRGDHKDVLRKIAVFEGKGHAGVLREFQRRTRQSEALTAFKDDAVENIKKLSEAAAFPAFQLDASSFDASIPEDAEALERTKAMQLRLTELTTEVQRLVKDANKKFQDDLTSLREGPLGEAILTARAAYNALKIELTEQGITDPSEYGRLVQQRQALETKLKTVENEQAAVQALKKSATEILAQILDHRRELTTKRNEFLQSKPSEFVKLMVLPYREEGAVEKELRDLLGMEKTYTSEIGTYEDSDNGPADGTLLADIAPSRNASAEDMETALDSLKNEIAALAQPTGSSARFRVPFTRAIQKLTPEQLDRLRLWWPEDSLFIEYKTPNDAEFKPIDQGSPGQKTSALLAFLLAYGTDPIILDQPEDDLDNQLITDLLVARIKEMKTKRQVIVVTHNANVVVNADAEYVIPLKMIKGKTYAHSPGGLQEAKVRESVCTIMEGGQRALARRFRRLVKDPHA